MKEKKARNHAHNSRIKFGILPKLLLGILAPLFVVLIIMGIFVGLKGSSMVNEIMGTELDAESLAASSQVEAFFERYSGTAECLASTQLFRDTLNQVTEGGITARPLFASVEETLALVQEQNSEDVSYIWLCDFQTKELVQSDGQILSNFEYSSRTWYQPMIDAKGTIATGAYQSASSADQIISIVTPVVINGTIRGAVGLDLVIDRLTEVLSEIKIGNDGYITLYDNAGQIIFHPDSSIVGTYAVDANYSSNMLDSITNKQDIDATLYTRNGTEYYGSTTSIGSLGYMVLGVMPKAEYVSHINAILRILIIGIIACGLLLAVICVFMALSITKPLKRLDQAVEKLADGDLDVEVDVHTQDEVGDVGENVKRIVERLQEYILYINEISKVLLQIGDGNLVFTLEHEYVGEFAKVKQALLSIRNTLTDAMTNIAQSADQVNAGAEQISSGAQALAQGATEQASSVQELSSAVQELSSQATEEAQKAVEAGAFLQQIKDEVEKSNKQMEQMQNAMSDISVQSSAIRSIIKTIDDIAFQTNILALNAAVEAARAGSVGKGFSVVADEVRSLAGKSAEAARKTNELIENSVRAVKHGEELTKMTADSLAIVSDGTRQVVDTIENVATAYHDQAGKLSEIARGVDQISNVVQTNSATAEESAAASEELSGQASMMRQQVAQFKLKPQDNTPLPIAPQEEPVAISSSPFDSPFKGKY